MIRLTVINDCYCVEPLDAARRDRVPIEGNASKERSCALVRKALRGRCRSAEGNCAWLLSAGYIDGYTGKPPFQK